MKSTMKTHALLITCMLIVAGEAMGGAAVTACKLTPAETAEIKEVETTILADIAAGKSFPQIQEDVARVVAGQPGVDVVVIFDEAISLLIDLGKIPPRFLTQAKLLQRQARSMRGAAECRTDGGM